MQEGQKERLEQELRFLKESLDAEVISKDEYKRGRERIERKLVELEESSEEADQPKEEKAEEGEEPQEPEIEIKEIKEKTARIIGAGEEEQETEEKEEPEKELEEPEEEKEEELEEKEEAEENAEEEKEEFKKEPEEEKKEEFEEKEEEPEEEKPEEKEEEVKISRAWLYVAAILIIALVLFFSIRGCSKPIEEKPSEENITGEFTPECSSDSDCKKEGNIGACLNPGTEEAKCEFKQDAGTNLVIINDENCKLCDTSNTETIIREVFQNLNIKEIDSKTEEGKRLIAKFSINALPAYIFDSNVSNAINFNSFRNALIKKGDSYIMTDTASGAVYYFRRPLIKNKVDLYLIPETNGRIESSMQEVADLFKDKINFTKNIVTEPQKDILEKELAINTYPTFLINNQLKFRGVLPADSIKEKICQVNYFEECKKELSKI